MPWERSQNVEFLEETMSAMELVALAVEAGAPLPSGAHADRLAVLAARLIMAIVTRDGDVGVRGATPAWMKYNL